MVAAVGSRLVCQLLFFAAFPIRRSAVVGAIDQLFSSLGGVDVGELLRPVCCFQKQKTIGGSVHPVVSCWGNLRTVVLELQTYGERRRAKNKGHEL